MPVSRSVQRSNRPPGSCPRNRPSSVRQAVVSLVRWRRRSAADDRWQTMNIHRLDGTLRLAASCNIMLMRAARLAGFLLTFIVVVIRALGDEIACISGLRV